jgi:Tfp pilus assembly protein FimT
MLVVIAAVAALFVLAACKGGSTGGERVSAGKNSVAYSVINSAPTESCPNGGITVYAGIDKNSNDVLDTSEISSTQYVCNGSNGSNGSNGQTTLVSVVSEPVGTNCTYGGNKVRVGLDANSNGVLDNTEISSSDYLCNGANGTNGSNGLTSLTAINAEAPGADCAAGNAAQIHDSTRSPRSRGARRCLMPDILLRRLI